MGASHRLAISDGVEERFRNRLAFCKRQYISKGGRLILIPSMLSNMLIYLFSLLHIPRKLRLRSEEIQRDFLWEGGSLEKKIHLVNWKIVCRSREGGYDIKCLHLFKKALLGKWNRRFTSKENSL